MMDFLAELVRGKRVLLLGFGMEGRSTYGLLKEIGSYSGLGIADMNAPDGITDADVHSGGDYLERIDDYDITFKSPGIVLPKNYQEYKSTITSQSEVFLQAYSRQIIGVTGTKGKSTVTSLLFHVLSSNGVPCILGGNIGIPVFELAKDMKPETIAVLELSCHQLEICKYSPSISVLLNIYEDHLDHYGTFEKYARTKKNIYLHQHPLDTLYCDESVKPAKGESVSRTVVIDKEILPFDSLDAIGGVKLRGNHNLSNCAFVYSIAQTLGITDRQFIASLKSYTPLRHRLELIGNINGVDYYDDSISTTVESAISAVESIKNTSTILLGGMDRGIDYTALAAFLLERKLTNVICMYESGQRIFDMLKTAGYSEPGLIFCKDLYEAAKIAREVSPPGTACILSPASASYGDFKNFEERGNVFRSLLA